jgi:hypothetical protein
MQRLQLVHEQGDGVRSLIGLMLLWYAGGHSVALVDEPEAFLHPPQAALLGRHLARQAHSGKRQLIMSTHSADIVRGVMLAGGSGDVVVARLTRTGDVNTAAVVSESVVKSLWEDPQLRYSNVFEGLFSDAVIICEAESDCKYFAAVLDAEAEAEEEVGGGEELTRRPDLLFTASGGKDRLHVAASAMTAASVPVRAIADFDLLRDEVAVKRLVEALGAEYTASMASRRNVVSAALAQETQTPNVLAVRERLIKVFDDLPDGAFTTKERDRVTKVLKTNSGWGNAKEVGIPAVPRGQARAAAEKLLTELEGVGLFVVPVGEAEGFVPDVGGHGPGWVAGVLEAGKHRAPHSEVARAFLGRLLTSL